MALKRVRIFGVKKKNNALDLMKKQREQTAGGPRKYIDNTVDIMNQTYA